MKKYCCFFLLLFLPFYMSAQEMSEYLLVRYNNAETSIEKGNVLLKNLQSKKRTPSEKMKLLLKQLAYFKDDNDEIGTAFTQLNIGYLAATTGDMSVAQK
jgi:hypothetical protein